MYVFETHQNSQQAAQALVQQCPKWPPMGISQLPRHVDVWRHGPSKANDVVRPARKPGKHDRWSPQKAVHQLLSCSIRRPDKKKLLSDRCQPEQQTGGVSDDQCGYLTKGSTTTYDRYQSCDDSNFAGMFDILKQNYVLPTTGYMMTN